MNNNTLQGKDSSKKLLNTWPANKQRFDIVMSKMSCNLKVANSIKPVTESCGFVSHPRCEEQDQGKSDSAGK